MELKYVLCFMLLMPAMTFSQNFISSRATYYGSPDCLGTPTGACGYGEYGRTVNDGNVAGVSRLWRNGTGCGGCYQVRCKAQQCNDEGAYIVVTDYGEGDNTDFILSSRAYATMAHPNMVAELFAYGVVNVEYRRIPCRYAGYNAMIKVHEHSKFPNYLAVIILYQGGLYDVLAVEAYQESCKEWRGMRRAYGAVFDIVSLSPEAVSLRFQLALNGEVTWVQAPNALPSDMKAGAAYDTQIQFD